MIAERRPARLRSHWFRVLLPRCVRRRVTSPRSPFPPDFLTRCWAELAFLKMQKAQLVRRVRQRREGFLSLAEQLDTALRLEADLCDRAGRHYRHRGDELAAYVSRGWAAHLRRLSVGEFLTQVLPPDGDRGADHG